MIKFDTINIFIRNMPQTVKFYSILGLSFKENDESEDYVKIEGFGSKICFYSLKTVQLFFGSSFIEHKKGFPFELGFKFDEIEKIDEITTLIRGKGFEIFKKPTNTDWGQRVAFFKDPDGNLIEISADLEP